MLLRKHIHYLLSKYYSQPFNNVIGSLPTSEPIAFRNILNEWHWQRIFRKLYKEQLGQWLTPVELFRPYFSQILANFIAKEAVTEKNVHIVELGGGRGTNALEILNYLKAEYPSIYERLHYTIMDASPSLLDLQKQYLIDSVEHAHVVDLREVDMFNVAEGRGDFLSSSDEVTVVLAMELFDNLPHDKIHLCAHNGSLLQTELQVDNNSHHLKEVVRPLQDRCLIDILQVQPNYSPSTTNPRWIPTVGLQILSKLFKARKNASLVLADFDYLPCPDIVAESVKIRLSMKADGEPLCTGMNDIDHECYITAPPLCDILFPTDFFKLSHYVTHLLENHRTIDTTILPWKVHVEKQSQFLLNYGPKQIEASKSRWTRYSPLLQDFTNCSVLYVSRSLTP